MHSWYWCISETSHKGKEARSQVTYRDHSWEAVDVAKLQGQRADEKCWRPRVGGWLTLVLGVRERPSAVMWWLHNLPHFSELTELCL